LEGSLTDLIEIKNKIESEKGYSVIVQVIASNHVCTISDCEKFPIVQPKIIQPSVGGRMLTATRIFTVDFNVSEASSKYICLNYNLETSAVVSTFTIPVVSDNGLTMTCEINGATQLFLDSSCAYLDKSKCTTPEEKDDSSGISTGAVIGIVLGAVAGSILFSISGFLLYKKLTKIRVINYDAK